MRVFVAGATGVLGRRAVALLVAAGHDVTGVARSPAKAALLRGIGATPAAIDLFDPAAVTEAAAGHDVVCNLATHIPPTTKAWRLATWRENDRIRTEASVNLAAAAVATGARFVQESIAFAYPDRGNEWISEDEPIDPPPVAASVLSAEASAGQVAAAGGVAVVLRFGLFYGTGSGHTADLLALAQRGLAPFPGDRDAHFPTVHLDDAARAVVTALAVPAGSYNVVDDGSLTRAEHASVLAAAVGRSRLLIAPRWVLRLGGESVAHLVRSQRPSNRKLRQSGGWEPRHRTPREGWPAVIAELGGLRPVAGLWQVLALVYLTVQGLSAGAQAAVTPRWFYDSFPMGRGWVAADGPFNEHLVRDVGGFFLALGFVALVAAVVRTGITVRVAAMAWTAFASVHLAYHAAHVDSLPTVMDQVVSLSSLTLTAAVALALLVWPTRAATAGSGEGSGASR